MEICSSSPKKALRRISWQTDWIGCFNWVSCRAFRTQPTSRRQYTALPNHRLNLFLCWPTWALGDASTLLRRRNYQFERSFLKKGENGCGRHSWLSFEASTSEHQLRGGQFSLNSKPHLSLLPECK